jgi:hypothetical protein
MTTREIQNPDGTYRPLTTAEQANPPTGPGIEYREIEQRGALRLVYYESGRHQYCPFVAIEPLGARIHWSAGYGGPERDAELRADALRRADLIVNALVLATTPATDSIRDHADFREDLERLSTLGRASKQAKIIRKSIYDTIDARVHNAVAAALEKGLSCAPPGAVLPQVVHRANDVLEGLAGLNLPGAIPARIAKLRVAVARYEAAVQEPEQNEAVGLLRRLKRDLMSARRFQPETLDTYRRACTSAETDIEGFLIALRATSTESPADAPAL